MNFFCRILGHTWSPAADNPRTSWNTNDEGLVLTARPSAEVRFYDVCLRCKERREVAVKRRTSEGAAPSSAGGSR
jgi:hypothetical protein